MDGQVDIWSVGVILYEALFGRAPYASGSLEVWRTYRYLLVTGRDETIPPCRRVAGIFVVGHRRTA
jgi:serine/threonine protein kinase